ncbi:MAG: flagellar hook-basal body complex protein FliE [Betaproteobacteria bacterium]
MDRISVESILSQIRAMQDIAAGGQKTPATETPGRVDFAQMLQTSLDQVSGAEQHATSQSQAFEKGDPNVNLQDVMISMQKANISFQTVVQVRNRVVAAYQDMMNMQM